MSLIRCIAKMSLLVALIAVFACFVPAAVFAGGDGNNYVDGDGNHQHNHHITYYGGNGDYTHNGGDYHNGGSDVPQVVIVVPEEVIVSGAVVAVPDVLAISSGGPAIGQSVKNVEITTIINAGEAEFSGVNIEAFTAGNVVDLDYTVQGNCGTCPLQGAIAQSVSDSLINTTFNIGSLVAGAGGVADGVTFSATTIGNFFGASVGPPSIPDSGAGN